MLLSGPRVTAMVVGAIIGAALVFPATVPVRWVNGGAAPLVLAVEGQGGVVLAPGQRVDLRLRRWGLTRYRTEFRRADASRGQGVLGPLQFRLYDTFTFITQDDGVAAGLR